MSISLCLAFALRFDGTIDAVTRSILIEALPIALAAQIVGIVVTHAHRGIWRYTSIRDLLNVIYASVIGNAIFYVLTSWVFRIQAFPRSIYIINCILMIGTQGGVRLIRRMLYERVSHRGRHQVLVFGAGKSGEMIVRDIKNNPFYDYHPVGFIDDDPAKVGQRIHNVPVLGTRADLPVIMAEENPDEILVALSKAAPAVIRSVVKLFEPYKKPIKIIPSLRDVLSGKLELNQIRRLSVEDLLDRAPVGLDTRPVSQFLHGRRVMVTGAGGSIGSELCRQIASFNPDTLLLFERYENSLYAIENDLRARNGNATPAFVPVIGDMTDEHRVREILEKYRPEIIFHAAAHKHVPLMELNICEAIKNNVRGTRILAQAASDSGVRRFILISTDKAVNPTSVMGATKRIAELMLLSIGGAHSVTDFITVRFGNVLGSNGSVVPRFLEQIKAGGPVTVTHPEMRRFFMLIPEAVQLVLHAGAHGERGAIYVLEMGEQVNILEMAHNLISLAGFIPEEEIPIKFIGLRPGEKLYEELVGENETVESSAVQQILKVCAKHLPQPELVMASIQGLERAAQRSDSETVLSLLGKLLPPFDARGKIEALSQPTPLNADPAHTVKATETGGAAA